MVKQVGYASRTSWNIGLPAWGQTSHPKEETRRMFSRTCHSEKELWEGGTTMTASASKGEQK